MEIRDRSTFLDYLASFHGRTRRVIMCVPPADLEWTPAPGKFSFGDIARHLAGTLFCFIQLSRRAPQPFRGCASAASR